jgi:hypothetical protein
MSLPLLLLPPTALRARMHAVRLANSPARQPTPCPRQAAALAPKTREAALRARGHAFCPRLQPAWPDTDDSTERVEAPSPGIPESDVSRALASRFPDIARLGPGYDCLPHEIHQGP